LVNFSKILCYFSVFLLTIGIIITIMKSNLVLDKPIKETEMKSASILRSIFGLALLCAVAVLGCENAANGDTPAATTYTVTFAAGEGSGTPPAAITAAENASVTLPGKGGLTEPAADRTFEGWTDGTSNYSAGDSYIVRGNITLRARWKAAAVNPYTVTFDADGGTGSTTRTVTPPATTVGTLPAAPTRAGYAFDGWFTAQNGGGTQFTETSPVAADTTVYAKWRQTNPLIGAWMAPVSDKPSHFIFFTNTDVYYSVAVIQQTPRSEFINTTYHTIKLRNNDGETKTYDYALTADGKMVVKKFAGNEDMIFVRWKGSTQAADKEEDLWIPESLSSENQWTYFFLIRGPATGNDILHNFQIGNWWNMDTYTYDSIHDDIRWTNIDGGNTPTHFRIDESGKLHITLPGLTYSSGEEIVFTRTTWF
jgi:uncharacterized repeat protein (TIGR02543 family)